jgi:hypothetical protein
VLQHLITFLRFGFQQELIDHCNGVGLFTEADGGLLQVLSPVRLLGGGSEKSVGEFRTSGLWRDE